MTTIEQINITEEFILKSKQPIFLTGKAGTGKTTLLKNVLPKLQKNYVILAPTGIAAINIGGMTIHSFFQFPLVAFVPTKEYVDINIANNQNNIVSHFKHNYEKIKIIRSLDLIIIDEASMVRCDMLDLIDFTLKHIRNSILPFGGVQMLLIGDLYQLSPVVKEDEWSLLKKYYPSTYFFDSHSWHNAGFTTITLSQVFRQNDSVFINALNAIRIGHCTPETIEYINKQTSRENNSGDDYITLTTHNLKAQSINDQQLENLPNPMTTFEAKIEGQFSESAYPNEKLLHLKIGSKVMFIRNDIEGLYYNGLIGTIINMDKEKVTIDCVDHEVTVGFVEWKNITYSLDHDAQKITSNEIGSFAQLPLKPAWAVTVHKSQGLTFDKIKLDLSDSFASGQVYVALSRAKTIEGIQLTKPLTLSNIIVDQHINHFYQKNTLDDRKLQELLSVSKKAYEFDQLLKVYDFDKLLCNLKTLNAHIIPLISKSNKRKYEDLMEDILATINYIQSTVNKFHFQLNALVDVNNSEYVKERCLKAAVYYADQLFNKCVIPIHAFILNIGTSSKEKKWVSELSYFYEELWFKIQEMYTAKWQDISMHPSIPYTKDMLEMTQEKEQLGDTFNHTLILFESGKSISEIAKIRTLKPATIEAHLKKLLAQGKVEILQLMSKNRIDQILPYLQTDELSLSELKGKMPFETSFAELNWVRTWLHTQSNMNQ